MFVDTTLLQIGARFSASAGGIAQDGATQFASAALPAGIFGDFEQAETFHSVLVREHQLQCSNLRSHHHALALLATKARDAAQMFSAQDVENGRIIDESGTATGL